VKPEGAKAVDASASGAGSATGFAHFAISPKSNSSKTSFTPIVRVSTAIAAGLVGVGSSAVVFTAGFGVSASARGAGTDS
jgi:hypothetical protein